MRCTLAVLSALSLTCALSHAPNIIVCSCTLPHNYIGLYETKTAASTMSVSFGQLLSMIRLAAIPTYGTESYRYGLPLLMRIWGHSPIIANRTAEACHHRSRISHQTMNNERRRRS
jgi:hypothetical protein